MNYQTYMPSEALAGFVKCYWTLEDESAGPLQRQVIVPDGCMEMIFHDGDLYRQYLDGNNSIIQPRCFVFGQFTVPLSIAPTGRTGIFAARFYPGGFMPFCTLPVTALEDRAVSLEDLYAQEGALLSSAVVEAGTVAQKIGHVEAFLLCRVLDQKVVDEIARATAELMTGVNGRMPIGKLAETLAISRRQLERRFASVVGLSPKQLSKIIRLQAVLKPLLRGQFDNLTALAYDKDYYDQAHFIRDFREFTGYTPKQFYGAQLELSRLFYSAG
ncbi:AraC family transcriptional regulator [Taibaiella helva]|uniref:AraC family transcriptional regulator n=1 Tax=Taibaiella helva TaxID=2301235 RepID=UPI000E56A407|nr:helix-turn-helix domain-containing protein [Taibaiella helva]